MKVTHDCYVEVMKAQVAGKEPDEILTELKRVEVMSTGVEVALVYVCENCGLSTTVEL